VTTVTIISMENGAPKVGLSRASIGTCPVFLKLSI